MVKFKEKKNLLIKWVSVFFFLLQWHLESYKNGNIWVIYMDGYDGHVNVCPNSPPPLIWCCSYTSCEEKMLWKTPFPKYLVKIITSQSTVTAERQKELMAWRRCYLKYTAPSHRNISSAVQLQIFHEHLRNSHYVTLRQKQILSLQHFSPSVNL